MKFGVVYPQTELGDDPAVIKDYAQTAESLGFTHILAYEHVFGANPNRPGGWSGPYTYRHAFLEPFVLFSYIAAHTQKIGLTTGILILPQRQTGLVAKQAASLDVLCGGRLRLGIGIGWNPIEYTTLNQDFHTRGKRIEEQIELLRLLWTQPLVEYTGHWHDIPDAGINPLPIQRPIPIWFGGHADAVLRRTAHKGDGWMPNYPNPQDAKAPLRALDQYLADYGRSRADIGIEARFGYGSGNPSDWAEMISGWRVEGATHLSFNTMGSGFERPSDHIQAIEKYAQFLNQEQDVG